MKVHFKHRRIIEGVAYEPNKPGESQEVPDELEKHWFIQGQVKAGHVVITEKPEPKDEEKEVETPSDETPADDSDDSTPATTQKRRR